MMTVYLGSKLVMDCMSVHVCLTVRVIETKYIDGLLQDCRLASKVTIGFVWDLCLNLIKTRDNIRY